MLTFTLSRWSCKDGTPEDDPEEKDECIAADDFPTRPLIPSLVLSDVDIERAWMSENRRSFVSQNSNTRSVNGKK